ncbi:uncharacterized protein LOC121890035 [Thunnus maccoyii]|uniref:uncharacterized protein LOC121890035 n=1 Tax=Thunnus maccoyii TaxID=8240 RepID=UPI001C4D8AF6|nr:uncharacterized protein LOC121890035 [Thunnus maccoyii]
MTPLTIALYLTCLFFGTLAQMNDLKSPKYVRQEKTFYSVNVGEDVTLECFYEDDAAVMFYYWYKQTLGQKPKLMSKFYKHDKNGNFQGEFKNYPRLELEASPGKNHLKISDVQISDSATYYCVAGYSYKLEFLEGTTLNVKGSGLNIQASVHQSESESIQPGGSVTLNCTVHTGTCDDGEHSVYWFKNSQESHPGIIYTHGGRNDQCERNNNTQTHTCVYNLPMKSVNLSHTGTYYCAVTSCGQIVFGNGTKMDIGNEVDFVLVYFLFGALAFSTILIVFLAYAAYTMNKNCCQRTESQERSPVDSTPDPESYRDTDDLHYAALRENKVGRSRRQRNDTGTECVYSSVKQ